MQNKTTIELLEESKANLYLKPHTFFHNRRDLIRSCVEDILKNNVENSDFIEKILAAPQRFTSLPYLSICVNKTRFNIYGFVHGAAPEESCLYRLSKSNKSKIRKIMIQQHNPTKGREVFLEENISELLTLPRHLEIDDCTQGVNMAVFQLPKIVGWCLKFKKVPYELLENLSVLNSRNEKKSNKISLLNFLSLYSLYYQGKSGEVQISYPLKEPLNLELNYAVEATRRAGEIFTDCSKRSLYTARKLLEFADNGNIPEVNYLGGLNHMTQIAYFLEHPDYSFKTIDDYILGKG